MKSLQRVIVRVMHLWTVPTYTDPKQINTVVTDFHNDKIPIANFDFVSFPDIVNGGDDRFLIDQYIMKHFTIPTDDTFLKEIYSCFPKYYWACGEERRHKRNHNQWRE